MDGTKNLAIIVGRVGSLKNGDTVFKMTLATVDLDKDKKQVTTWHNVDLLGEKVAKRAMKVIDKGQTVMVIGSIQHRKSVDRDGVKVTMTSIASFDFEIVKWADKSGEKR